MSPAVAFLGFLIGALLFAALILAVVISDKR